MANDGFPYFPLYTSDFLGDSAAAVMDNGEIGCFFLLLLYQWTEGGKGITSNPAALARLCRCSPEAFASAWAVVGPCFQPHPQDPDKLINPKLHGLYLDAVQGRAKRAEVGRKFGRGMSKATVAPAVVKPAAVPAPVKLAYKGQRFQVWTWLHDELVRALGAKPFDLLGWYPKLDAEMVKSGAPIADESKWIRERLYQAAGLERPNLFGKRPALPPGLAPCDAKHNPPCVDSAACWERQQRERKRRA